MTSWYHKIIPGNQDENFALILDELATVKAMLEEQRKISESLVVLGNRLDKIEKTINKLQSGLDRLAENMASRPIVAEKIASRLTSASSSAAPQSKPTRQPDRVTPPKSEAPAEISATLYAKGSSDGILTPVPQEYADIAPFIITATGNCATVEFNNRCVARLLPKVESQLIPYFDYEILSGNPTFIHGENTVKATRMGDKWMMDGRIKITIS